MKSTDRDEPRKLTMEISERSLISAMVAIEHYRSFLRSEIAKYRALDLREDEVTLTEAERRAGDAYIALLRAY